MSLSDNIHKDVPEYHSSMYLDGYTPQQILHAARQKLLNQLTANQTESQVKIVSEVKVK